MVAAWGGRGRRAAVVVVWGLLAWLSHTTHARANHHAHHHHAHHHAHHQQHHNNAPGGTSLDSGFDIPGPDDDDPSVPRQGTTGPTPESDLPAHAPLGLDHAPPRPPAGGGGQLDDLGSHPGEPDDTDGLLAKVASGVNGHVWVKEDVMVDVDPHTAQETGVVERSMFFDGAVGPQSVVRCVKQTQAAETTCCHGPSCCTADSSFIPDGYLGLSLLSLPLFETLAHRAVQSVLVLGLGGGSLPTYLRAHYPGASVVVVEVDPVVVDTAKTFFGFCEGGTVDVVTEDAFSFINSAAHDPAFKRGGGVWQGKFDVVFFDMFVHNEIPAQMLSKEFMRGLQSVMHHGSVVVANVFSVSPVRIQGTSSIFRKAFPSMSVSLQAPLEMSMVTYSVLADARLAATFSLPLLVRKVEAHVQEGALPEVLQRIANSTHFARHFAPPQPAPVQ